MAEKRDMAESREDTHETSHTEAQRVAADTTPSEDVLDIRVARRTLRKYKRQGRAAFVSSTEYKRSREQRGL